MVKNEDYLNTVPVAQITAILDDNSKLNLSDIRPEDAPRLIGKKIISIGILSEQQNTVKIE